MSLFSYFDTIFAPVADTIQNFADEHGAIVLKYDKDGPAWTVGFGHPAGGQAKLDVISDLKSHFVIESIWWIDDRQDWTRKMRRARPVTTPAQASEVRLALDAQLGEILSWELGTWDRAAPMFFMSGELSPEQYQRYYNPWPIVT